MTKEEKDAEELDLSHVLDQQLSKFGLEMSDLPEDKQEELENRVSSIEKGSDLKRSAAQELKKAVGGR